MAKYLGIYLFEEYQKHTGKPASDEVRDFARWLGKNLKAQLNETEIVNTIVEKGTRDPNEDHHQHLDRVAREIANNPKISEITLKQEEQPHV